MSPHSFEDDFKAIVATQSVDRDAVLGAVARLLHGRDVDDYYITSAVPPGQKGLIIDSFVVTGRLLWTISLRVKGQVEFSGLDLAAVVSIHFRLGGDDWPILVVEKPGGPSAIIWLQEDPAKTTALCDFSSRLIQRWMGQAGQNRSG